MQLVRRSASYVSDGPPKSDNDHRPIREPARSTCEFTPTPSSGEDDPRLMLPMMRTVMFAENWIILPSLILLGVFGVLAGFYRGYDLIGTGWIVVSFFVGLLALVLSIAVMHAASSRLVGALERSVETSAGMTEEVRRLLADPRPQIGGAFLFLLTVFALVLMVFKLF